MIDLAKHVSFDATRACTSVFAFMGIRGSGKSYGFGVLAEGLIDAGEQLVIFDPMGVFWGLRLAANGKSDGLNIPVFGGDHGDVPLTVASAKMVAELVVERRLSAVLDVSEFRMHERKEFVGAFCEHLYEVKKKNRTPLHVAFDEADLFAPQEKAGDNKKGTNMLSAVEHLARRGRNLGIGCSFISQRPQEVNKGILNQAEVLVAMQLNGDLDRQAIERWARQKATRDQMKDANAVFDMLPELEVGECIVWSPRWLKCRVKTKINRKWTYDSSKTPDGTEAAKEPQPLLPGDLTKLREAMQSVATEVANRDPEKLRARVAQLEHGAVLLRRETDEKTSANAWLQQRVRDLEDKTTSALSVGERAILERRLEDVEAAFNNNVKQVNETIATCKAMLHATGPAPSISSLRVDKAQERFVDKALDRVHKQERVAVESGWVDLPPNGKAVTVQNLRDGARRMLRALVDRHPKLVTRKQCAMLAGMSVKSGTFSTYLGELKKLGVCQKNDDLWIPKDVFARLTGDQTKDAEGMASVGREAVLNLWLPKFRGGVKRMLTALIAEWDEGNANGMTREVLAQVAEMSKNSGTFSTYLGELKASGLVEEHDGHISITEELWT